MGVNQIDSHLFLLIYLFVLHNSSVITETQGHMHNINTRQSMDKQKGLHSKMIADMQARMHRCLNVRRSAQMQTQPR